MNELCIVMIIDRMYYDLFRSKSSPLKKASHDAEIDWARRSVLLMKYDSGINVKIYGDSVFIPS